MNRFIFFVSSLRVIIISFFVAYSSFYLWKTLGEPGQMLLYGLLPAGNPKGMDINEIIATYRAFWTSPFPVYSLPYPPFSAVLFYPLTLVSQQVAYELISVASLIFLFLAFLVIPNRFGFGKSYQMAAALTLPLALTSYGFLFELERGQCNFIAVFLSLYGVGLYRFGGQFNRFFGLFLFSVGVHLKVYPLIFSLLAWDQLPRRNDLMRVGAIFVGINACLLLALGPEVLGQFCVNLTKIMNGEPLQVVSASVKSYTGYLQNLGYSSWKREHLIYVLMLSVSLCLLITLFGQARFKAGASPYKVINVFVVAIVIPSVSYDYKLPFLSLPMAYFWGYLFAGERNELSGRIGISLLFLLSFCYFGTLFSYVYRPAIIANSFPFVFGMMICSTILDLRHRFLFANQGEGDQALAP